MPDSAEYVAPTRLYGTVGAETMHVTPESVYESEIEPWHEDPLTPGKRVEIEEWDVHPPRHHMPCAAALLDWISEWTAENGEVDEYFDLDDVVKRDEVRQGAEFLLDCIANKVRYRMARTHLRSLWVTWNDAGEPLLNGEPMYVKAEHSDG